MLNDIYFLGCIFSFGGWERKQEDARGSKRNQEEGSKRREARRGKQEEGRIGGKNRRDRNWNNLTGSGHEKEARPLLA